MLQGQLEALATRSKKGKLQAVSGKAKIWQALNSHQAKLAPSMGTQIRTARAIRNWRLGKSRDWKQDEKLEWKEREVEYGPRIAPDFVASLVRHAFLLRERGCSETQAVKGRPVSRKPT